MNKVEFIFKLVKAGYTQEQCIEIEEILDNYSKVSTYSKQEIRDAACQYLICCREIDKLRGFLLLSEELNRSFCAGWEASYKFVLNVVVGWCH